jgi:transposase
MIAVCRLRDCERTLAYAERRTAEGKTKTETIRCLKRYIAREIYHALITDLLPAPAPRHRDPIVSITCGAGPIGRTLRTT